MKGDDALERARAELDRQDAEREARKNAPLAPFRYFTKVGEESEIIIADDRPSFFRKEHCLKDRRTGRYDVYVPCIDEHCACPACAVSERQAYFAMYLTVVDLTQYYDKDDNLVEFSKKLLVVKPTQQKKIMRYYDRHGSLRGMRLQMVRADEKSASIGDPEFIDFVDEETLQGYYFDYTNKEGETIQVLCDEPYDYEALMPDMDEESMRALVGGEAPVGSRRNDDRALGRPNARPARGAAAQDDGDDGWQGAGRRVASRRTPSAPPAEATDADQDDDQPEAAPARRPAPRGAAPARTSAPPARAPARAATAPARAPARRPVPAAQLDPDDDPSAGSDAPWGGEDDGAAAPAAAAPAQRAPARRQARPAPEPAPAPAVNAAARRANLRRGG